MIWQLGRFGEQPLALGSNIADSESTPNQYSGSVDRSQQADEGLVGAEESTSGEAPSITCK